VQLHFHPVAAVGRLVKKMRQLYTEGATIHKTIQKHRVNKAENTYKTKKHEKNILKKHKSSN